jgi:hypothetical protein
MPAGTLFAYAKTPNDQRYDHFPRNDQNDNGLCEWLHLSESTDKPLIFSAAIDDASFRIIRTL